ncbi:MAG: hypothetical protein IT336_11665 [Thermomicrobiales bacterium]|nr:hypothetical protein [Thermomicrobiales bacterium]
MVRSVQDLPGDIQGRLRTGSAYVDIRCDRFTAQAWQAISNLEATLAAAGSALDRLVLLRVVFRRAVDVPTFLRIAEICLGPRLPACDLLVGSIDGSSPDMDIVVDGIAVTTDRPTPVAMVLPDMARLTAPFPTAIRADPFLFTSALPGVDPTSGESPGSARYLNEEDRRLVEALRPADPEIERFFVDQATMWRNLRKVLSSAGLSLADVVYHGAWLTKSMQYLAFGSVPRLMTGEFREFCLTCFTVGGLAHPRAQWSGRLVATLRGTGRSARIPLHPLSRAYYGMVQASSLILTAGEVPIDVERGVLVDRPSRLPEADRGLLSGHPQPAISTAAQVACIYRLLAGALRAYDLGFDAVAHQTIYLTDLSDLPTAMLIAGRAYGGHLPPTSAVPVLGVTAFDDARVEIEVVGAARA